MPEATTSAFAVTTPTPLVSLGPNRVGEATFTVTNLTGASVRVRAVLVPLANTPAAWLSVRGKADRDLPISGTDQFVVVADPPLGSPVARYGFRLDVIGVDRPDVSSRGQDCAFDLPASQAVAGPAPRGYLAALLGAVIGGAVGETLIVLAAATTKRSSTCTGSPVGCAVSDVIGKVALFVFLVLVGLIMLWVGAVLGTYIGLRVKRYRGSKRTAVFVLILYVPWLVLMLALVNAIHLSFPVAVAVAPLVLLAVPALLSRAALLLFTVHHL